MSDNQRASNQLSILSFIEATPCDHRSNQLENRDDISTSTTLSSLTSDLNRNACGPSCEPSTIPNPLLTNYTVNSVAADNPGPSYNVQPEANISNIAHMCPSDTLLPLKFHPPSTYITSYIYSITIRIYRV